MTRRSNASSNSASAAASGSTGVKRTVETRRSVEAKKMLLEHSAVAEGSGHQQRRTATPTSVVTTGITTRNKRSCQKQQQQQDCRRLLNTRLKNIDRLQQDIENSFRDAHNQMADDKIQEDISTGNSVSDKYPISPPSPTYSSSTASPLSPLPIPSALIGAACPVSPTPSDCSPTESIACTPLPTSPLRVKLLLRKRSPVLDEVILGWGDHMSESGKSQPRSGEYEYEVLRVEGVESGDEIRVDPEISFNKNSVTAFATSTTNKTKKGKRKRESMSSMVNSRTVGSGCCGAKAVAKDDSPTKMKRLRLLMGSEKLSTVNYSWMEGCDRFQCIDVGGFKRNHHIFHRIDHVVQMKKENTFLLFSTYLNCGWEIFKEKLGTLIRFYIIYNVYIYIFINLIIELYLYIKDSLLNSFLDSLCLSISGSDDFYLFRHILYVCVLLFNFEVWNIFQSLHFCLYSCVETFCDCFLIISKISWLFE